MLSTKTHKTVGDIKENRTSLANGPDDPPTTQRLQLFWVWLAAGSAVAAMTAIGWYKVVKLGGVAPGGDMVGHAATAEWLKTLPWWDWRGWSDWFYGGQAIGVSYPPLGHAWMRFTHPAYGQLFAVTIGLLVLLPWGALCLARAVGLNPRAQRAAVASVLVLTAASGQMHWVLSGFHYRDTFFGSWPAMLAVVVGLFIASFAARCDRPAVAGVLAGLAVLLNASVVPGIAIVSAVLILSSGASRSQIIRWVATAGASALVVCAWWLVPFLTGSSRLVRYHVPLSEAWSAGGEWQLAILAALGVGAVWASLHAGRASKRLGLAATVALVVTILADLFGYLRSERWLELPILVAVVAIAGATGPKSRHGSARLMRPSFSVIVALIAVLMVPTVDRWEFLPLAVWALWGLRPRIWAWGGVLAWSLVLLWVPFWSLIRNPPQPPPDSSLISESVTAESGPDAEGTVYIDRWYNTNAGDAAPCTWLYPWAATARSEGRIRTLDGLYGTTSATAEFTFAEQRLRSGTWHAGNTRRPHWYDAWRAGDSLSLDSTAAADALGARWYVECDADDTFTVFEGPDIRAEGAKIVAYPDEDSWHKAAVEWWVEVASESAPLRVGGVPEIPVLWPGAEDEGTAAQLDRAAQGVTMRTEQDRVFVTAESPGWVWLRVPWDPWWFAPDGVPLKGGPGHLVIWADTGTTELRWDVPDNVDLLAVSMTVLALLLLIPMTSINRRKGWELDPDRPRPTAAALTRFADTTDRALTTAARTLTRKPKPTPDPDPTATQDAASSDSDES